ncbi:excalibur calcium-binding domain-containing protein [Variovorax sp. H27-G14]|uniref:excalibur calcium-binding domain-containing protein n=1 Tax=Variovorax sp. H27-G14 TaxID=3111914 RepID=UPI0038FC980E
MPVRPARRCACCPRCGWAGSEASAAEPSSRAEANYFLKNCPGVKMDGNNDGVPCEQQWCRRSEAAIFRQIVRRHLKRRGHMHRRRVACAALLASTASLAQFSPGRTRAHAPPRT